MSEDQDRVTEGWRRKQRKFGQAAWIGFQEIAPPSPLSSESSRCMSSSSREKSYTFVFDQMRAGVADLGRGT